MDTYLSEKLSITRTKIKSMIEGGHIRITGKPPKPSTKMKKFIEIDGEIPEEEPLMLEPQEIPLNILYEDEYFLAINKPKGMVVHPSFGHRDGTLVNAVLAYLTKQGSRVRGFKGSGERSKERRGESVEGKEKGRSCEVTKIGEGEAKDTEAKKGSDGSETAYRRIGVSAIEDRNDRNPKSVRFNPDSGGTIRNSASAAHRPGIVHRLDKDTTGVIIVAKDSRTQEMLSALFKERSVRKTYRAVVEEIVMKNEGIIEGNIGRHPTNRKKMAVLKEGGRDASTAFKVIKRLNGFTYIEAYPKTGRTHQIRVHLTHMGHPIVGDEAYGKRAKHVTERPLLHAHRIEFIHPVTGMPVFIEAPVPADIEEFIDSHGVYQWESTLRA
ncbi:MAG: RluA family pseudouridine synthase [Proteobacteria bacterium]|nr:RluA family pseudouridine synthase [Pseudomonadota bacterium]